MPYKLYAIDDASDRYTGELLRELLDRIHGSAGEYLSNSVNEGYLRSVNKAAFRGENEFIVLVNSDTVVLPGFLERVYQAFEADPSIGIVSAVSNWANWTRVCWRIPPGHNILSLQRAISDKARSVPTDINNASGFFFAVRRGLFESLDGFDEAYGKGYWEETDFSMKVLEGGSRVVVDEGLFVYHHGWASFSEAGRNEHMLKNRDLFLSRWGAKFEQLEAQWRQENPISYVDSRLIQRQEEYPAWLDNATATQPWERTRYGTLSQRSARAKLEGMRSDPTSISVVSEDGPGHKPDGRARVIYVLPAVKAYGGVISVLQLVNELILRGFDANVATAGEVDESVFDLFPTLFAPYKYANEEHLVTDFPSCDLIIATAWSTAYPVALIATQRRGVQVAYFVQDFEPEFYPSTDLGRRRLAEETYRFIPNKIVKTRWLERKLRPFGGQVTRIPLGLNEDFFRPNAPVRYKQVIALARPQSSRRNFQMVVRVFRNVARQVPDARLALYGFGYDSQALPFDVIDYGKLTKMADIASALSQSTVLLDCSTFQGFGRPGLEAMACGTLAVLTRVGGITEYAKHEHNCLLVDPDDETEITAKLVSCLEMPERFEDLRQRGFETARQYSLQKEADHTARLFADLLCPENASP